MRSISEIETPSDSTDANDKSEPPIPEPEGIPITLSGNLWRLGDHRVYCGDALDRRAYQILMDGNRGSMAFTDPPYNVKIDGNVSGLGRVRHREFAMAAGEMNEAQFTSFLTIAWPSPRPQA